MNLDANAPDESLSRGSSFVMMTNRVGSRPVHGSLYLRSTVKLSSPDTDNSRSTTILLSALLERRASDTSARGLPVSGDSPKFVERLAKVGAATLWLPSNPVSTRPMV